MDGQPKAFLILTKKDNKVIARLKSWPSAFKRWQQAENKGVKAHIVPVY